MALLFNHMTESFIRRRLARSEKCYLIYKERATARTNAEDYQKELKAFCRHKKAREAAREAGLLD